MKWPRLKRSIIRGLLAAFVRDRDRLFEDVGVAVGVRGGGVGRVNVEDLAEVEDERLRVRPLGGAEPLHFSRNSDGVACDRV
jgi:hypothetical protein